MDKFLSCPEWGQMVFSFASSLFHVYFPFASLLGSIYCSQDSAHRFQLLHSPSVQMGMAFCKSNGQRPLLEAGICPKGKETWAHCWSRRGKINTLAAWAHCRSGSSTKPVPAAHGKRWERSAELQSIIQDNLESFAIFFSVNSLLYIALK